MKKAIVIGMVLAVMILIGVGAWIRTSEKIPALSTNTASAEGNGERPGGGWGQNQTAMTDWKTLKGSVTSVDGVTLIIKTEAGNVTVENRPWAFALEQKFSAQVGDQIQVTGFNYNGIYQVAKLENLSNGKTIVLRDEYGRPGWSGNGRNRGG